MMEIEENGWTAGPINSLGELDSWKGNAQEKQPAASKRRRGLFRANSPLAAPKATVCRLHF
jgi:hypothetical protein